MAKSHAPDVLGAGTSPRPVARSLIGPLYRSACPIRSGVGAWWALAQKSACHPNASPKMNLQTCKGNQHPTNFTDPGSITQSTFSIKKQTNITTLAFWNHASGILVCHPYNQPVRNVSIIIGGGGQTGGD